MFIEISYAQIGFVLELVLSDKPLNVRSDTRHNFVTVLRMIDKIFYLYLIFYHCPFTFLIF